MTDTILPESAPAPLVAATAPVPPVAVDPVLTPNFSFEEMTFTKTGLPNVPNKVQVKNLLNNAKGMEQVRALLKAPIKVNSAFRSPAVNKAVGGVASSAHLLGNATDFVAGGNAWSPFEICEKIVASDIPYRQLILEKNAWVHIDFGGTARENLTFNGKSYAPGINR